MTEHTTSMHTAVKIRPSTESNHQPGPETSKASPPSPRTLIAKANWLQCHISFSKHEGKEGHILSAAEKSLPTAATILSDEKIRKGGNK